MALTLIDIAKERHNDEMLKAFWNTYHCLNRVVSHDGKMFGAYCKNRACTVCNGIRKAELIGKYYPTIKEWTEPYFVTLTIKAIKANRLNLVVKKLKEGFETILRKYSKRHQRGKGIKLVGIKSLECNFNPEKGTYNPHFHLIVANKKIADTLINEWLLLWKSKWSNRLAQKSIPIKNLENALVEIIKYGTKIFTEPDVRKKVKGEKNSRIYAGALFNILWAMKSHRLFERFGFNLPPNAKAVPFGARIVTDFEEWFFDIKSNNWLHSENELTLTDSTYDHLLMSYLENSIDKENS